MHEIEFGEYHPVGFCKIPRGFSHMPVLEGLFGGRSRVPDRIDERPRFGKAEDQGRKPWCAAYAASQWAENILWRTRDRFPPDNEIDPAPIYAYAKSVDGNPGGDGTTLPAVLEALLTRSGVRLFDPSVCQVRIIRASGRDKIKYAVHKFGTVIGGFNVTREWYGINGSNTCVTGRDREMIGGHAVAVCGYDDNGVYIINSWGRDWGNYGSALIAWDAFDRQFMYGAVLSNCLNGIDV